MLEKTSGRVRRGSKTKTRVRVVEDGRVRVRPDTLATEEPMEIRLLSRADDADRRRHDAHPGSRLRARCGVPVR